MMHRLGRTPGWISAALGAIAALIAPTVLAQPTAPEPPPPVEPWHEALDLGVFADAYASFNTNLPKRADDANQLRAFDTTTGFALAWAGADVAYEPAPVGGALSLRLGPAAERYSQTCLGDGDVRCDGDVLGLGLVKQAFASWQPLSALRLDLGKFDSPYGVEVAESQDSLLYSRGVVYWLGEPGFHTGLRATVAATPWLTARAMVVNGWNNSIDNNFGKSFGAQLLLAATRDLRLGLGWLGGPEQTDHATVTCAADTAYDPRNGACWPAPGAPGGDMVVDRGGANDLAAWRHLLNLVATWQPVRRLQLTLDGVFVQEGVREERGVGTGPGPDGTLIVALSPTEVTARYLGAALAARYALTDAWAVAGRGEYLADPDGLASGIAGFGLVTATFGLELDPSPALKLRLEGRGDVVTDADGSREIFAAGARDVASSQLTATLSAVVRTF